MSPNIKSLIPFARSTAQRRKSSHWKTVAKILVSLLAIYWVSRQVNLKDLSRWIAIVPWSYLVAGLLLYNGSRWVGAMRLNQFFKSEGILLRRRDNLLLYYKGMFYNLFLPGGIGGDGYKILIIKQQLGYSWRRVFKAVLWDRLSGACAMGYLIVLMAVFMPAGFWPTWILVLAFAALVFIFPISYLFTRWLAPTYSSIFVSGMFLAMVIQVIQMFVAVMIFAGLDISAGEMVAYIFVFFISSLASFVPITIGGVGLRELVYLFASQYLLIDQNKAVAFSVLFFTINALSSMIGIFPSITLRNPYTTTLDSLNKNGINENVPLTP